MRSHTQLGVNPTTGAVATHNEPSLQSAYTQSGNSTTPVAAICTILRSALVLRILVMFVVLSSVRLCVVGDCEQGAADEETFGAFAELDLTAHQCLVQNLAEDVWTDAITLRCRN